MFLTLFRKIRKNRFPYDPVLCITLDQKKIQKNLSLFQKRYPNCQIAPVLKSNAYGHGLIPVAKILENESIPFLCVDSYFEALTLRNEGCQKQILVLGSTPLQNIHRSRTAHISFTLVSMEMLEKISQTLSHPQSFHLEINTGMNRHGIGYDEIHSAAILIQANKNIRVHGAFSHFADADTLNSPQTRNQIERWNSVQDILRSELSSLTYFHLAATAGSIFSEQIKANVIRLGIGLYGISPVDTDPDLSPALEFKTTIASLRTILPGDRVGYNGTYCANKKMKIATIPAGYAEGIDLRLSNTGIILVKDIPCPLLGRVSMNITIVDVSHIPDVVVDDPVTIISNNTNHQNSIEQIAKICKTIPYEILVHLPAHIRRICI